MFPRKSASKVEFLQTEDEEEQRVFSRVGALQQKIYHFLFRRFLLQKERETETGFSFFSFLLTETSKTKISREKALKKRKINK